MNKSLKMIIFIVMLTAVAVVVLCGIDYFSLGNELRSLDRQLSESREKWEAIAAEKESLQVNLNADKKKLNQLQLTLDNKLKEAEEIRAEIEQLRSDIEALKLQQDSGS